MANNFNAVDDSVTPLTAPGSLEEIGLEKLLCHRITVVSKLMNRLAGRYLAREFDITIAEWWMLSQLDEYSPRTLRWLADTTFTDKAQMSRAAASLVERGLVHRKTDPADARSVLFSITAEGRAVSAASGDARREANSKLLNLLSPMDREALYSSLDELTASLIDDIQRAEADAGS